MKYRVYDGCSLQRSVDSSVEDDVECSKGGCEGIHQSVEDKDTACSCENPNRKSVEWSEV